jgi:hypothetical protein
MSRKPLSTVGCSGDRSQCSTRTTCGWSNTAVGIACTRPISSLMRRVSLKNFTTTWGGQSAAAGGEEGSFSTEAR